MMETSTAQNSMKAPEARYAYYQRCQDFRKNGEQCKAPAEKGSQICHAHAGQRAMALRRERERGAVLAEAVMVMRKKGHLQYEMADLFTSFNGIQATLAVMAKALIGGRIDYKTAGRLVVHLQTMAKLLRVYHRRKALTTKDTKEHKGLLTVQDELPQTHGKPELPGQICADVRRSGRTLPLIHTDNTDRTDQIDRNGWRGMEDAKVVKIIAIRGATRVNAIPYTDTGPSRWRQAA
jgi:hypothetical protein